MFLLKTIFTTFIFLLILFIVQNFKKFLLQIQNFDNALFLDPKWSICPNFFLENYCYHSRLPVSTFRCAKFKKSSSSKSRVMRMCNFWVQNDPFTQMRIVSENLFASLVSLFMPIYMPKIKVRY